jgi:hypothetical protein
MGVSSCNCDINIQWNLLAVYYTTLRYTTYGTNSTVLNVPCWSEDAHARPLSTYIPYLRGCCAQGLPPPTRTNSRQVYSLLQYPPHCVILHAAPGRGSPAARARNSAASLSSSRRSGQSPSRQPRWYRYALFLLCIALPTARAGCRSRTRCNVWCTVTQAGDRSHITRSLARHNIQQQQASFDVALPLSCHRA